MICSIDEYNLIEYDYGNIVGKMEDIIKYLESKIKHSKWLIRNSTWKLKKETAKIDISNIINLISKIEEDKNINCNTIIEITDNWERYRIGSMNGRKIYKKYSKK